MGKCSRMTPESFAPSRRTLRQALRNHDQPGATTNQVLALPGFRDGCADASGAVCEDRRLAVRDDHPLELQRLDPRRQLVGRGRVRDLPLVGRGGVQTDAPYRSTISAVPRWCAPCVRRTRTVFAVRIEAAVLREKRIDKDDLVIGLVAHQLLRPVLACAW